MTDTVNRVLEMNMESLEILANTVRLQNQRIADLEDRMRKYERAPKLLRKSWWRKRHD